MKKYYIGLLIIVLVSLGLIGFTVFEGLNSRQDNITDKRSKEIAKDLNKYISKERKIPQSLSDAGIKDVPSTIKYEKTSESTYKFCATYRKASDYGFSDGITPLLTGGAVSQFDEPDPSYYDDYESTYSPSTLYPSYSHKKGENCQTIKPYSLSSRSNNYDYNYSAPSSITTKADDTERQADIKAIHAQIEAYYAQNGKYPTLANLNDKTFRSTNMKNLDTEALKDPNGSDAYLSSLTYKNVYGYKATASDGRLCNNTTADCTKYTLTATLANGTTYTKNSLN